MLTTHRFQLQELLKRKGMSVQQLADASGVPAIRIEALCQQPQRDERLAILEQLALALEMPICSLWTRISNAKEGVRVNCDSVGELPFQA